MRTQYESDKDREHEVEFARRLMGKYEIAEMHKLPKCLTLDFALLDEHGKLTGLIEFKARNLFPSYKTIFLSMGKCDRAAKLCDLLGCRWFFCVLDIQSSQYLRIDPRGVKRFHVQIGGRTDRPDPADQELMVHFHRDDFEVMPI